MGSMMRRVDESSGGIDLRGPRVSHHFLYNLGFCSFYFLFLGEVGWADG